MFSVFGNILAAYLLFKSNSGQKLFLAAVDCVLTLKKMCAHTAWTEDREEQCVEFDKKHSEFEVRTAPLTGTFWRELLFNVDQGSVSLMVGSLFRLCINHVIY